MKNKWVKLALLSVPVLFSSHVMAATMSVMTDAELTSDRWLIVSAFGQPTSYESVGGLGLWGDVRETSGPLQDDKYGQYRITAIKYCIGTSAECFNMANYRDCDIQDYTNLPVNTVNAQVSVRVLGYSCTATIEEGFLAKHH